MTEPRTMAEEALAMLEGMRIQHEAHDATYGLRLVAHAAACVSFASSRSKEFEEWKNAQGK